MPCTQLPKAQHNSNNNNNNTLIFYALLVHYGVIKIKWKTFLITGAPCRAVGEMGTGTASQRNV